MFHRDKPTPSLFLGQGQAEGIMKLCQDNKIDLLIFDDDLNPVQTRNLQKMTQARVLDRSQLILDIFAKNARTKQAQLQVELAQLKYLYPRLTGQWTHFSKQVGGIGVRGPGETQLEVDRRRVKERISKLIQLLKEIAVNKQVQSKRRSNSGIANIALIGYTNAGKSTLFNYISRDIQYTADKLFATLDTVVRMIHGKNSQEYIISDTVGFIHKLPHHLIASFKTTLAEAANADILIHVLDASDPYAEQKIQIVQDVLKEIELSYQKMIFVFNKADLLTPMQRNHSSLKQKFDGVFVSSLEGWGVDQLFQKIEFELKDLFIQKKFMIPMADLKWVSFLEEHAKVIKKSFEEDGCHIEAKYPKSFEQLLEKYIIP